MSQISTSPSSPSEQSGGAPSGLLPGYFDPSLILDFTSHYSPGNHQHCDLILTEPMLRDLFNAHRDQDMTFTDPWLQYKSALKSRGYQLRPNPSLGSSVMYLLENDIEPAEEL